VTTPDTLSDPVRSAITGLLCLAMAVQLGRLAIRRGQATGVRVRLASEVGQNSEGSPPTARANKLSTPGGWEVLAILAVVTGTTALDLPLWGVITIGFICALTVAFYGPKWLRQRNTRLLEEQVPDALDVLGTLLRRGMTMSAALIETGTATPAPLGLELQRTGIDARHRGVSEALDQLALRRPSLRAITVPLGIAAEASVDATGIVVGISSALRSESDVAREMAAQAAQAKLSGRVMVVTPIVFAGLLSMSDPGARHFLVATPVGIGCCVVGLTLDLVGWIWIRAITKATEQ
jgi:tight adherence protein B